MKNLLVCSTVMLAASMSIASAGGVDCTGETGGAKNLGQYQKQLKADIANDPAYDGYIINNWAQFTKAEDDMDTDHEYNVGDQTQSALAGCGIGSRVPHPPS
jgi:hypothetical protein